MHAISLLVAGKKITSAALAIGYESSSAFGNVL